MKSFPVKKCLQYYLPLTLTLFMLVTIERTVVTDGGYTKLYGLPFPFISNSYAFSMSYDVYILAMGLNFLVYFIIVILAIKTIENIGLKLKTHWLFIFLGVTISVFWIAMFAFITMDSFFYLTNDTDYLVISQRLIFGMEP